jgi:hypothetical protein
MCKSVLSLALAAMATPALSNADIEEGGVKWTYLDQHKGATFYHVEPFVHASLDMLMIDKKNAQRANVRLKFDCIERTYRGTLKVFADDVLVDGGMIVPGSHLEKAMKVACAFDPPTYLPRSPAETVLRATTLPEPSSARVGKRLPHVDPSKLPPELRR